MKSRHTGESQSISAAKAGISERSGRRIEGQTRTARAERKRDWRTREDPFKYVWANELLPLLEQTPNLQGITLLEYLQEKYPEQYPDSLHRTLQRRVKQWRALYGPEQEVMFRQVHAPGRQGLSDFTQLKETTITAGFAFRYCHGLYRDRCRCEQFQYHQYKTRYLYSTFTLTG